MQVVRETHQKVEVKSLVANFSCFIFLFKTSFAVIPKELSTKATSNQRVEVLHDQILSTEVLFDL